MNIHPAESVMRGLLSESRQVKKQPENPKTIFDGAGSGDATEGTAQGTYANTDLRMKAASIAHAFALTAPEDLDEGESLADRLMMLVVGAVDADVDGELSEAEVTVANALLENLWDFLSSKGVSDDDCAALLDNWDVEAAGRVKDLLAETLPGDDDADADMDAFAFDEEAEQSLFDSTGNLVTDAVYRKKVVVRQGRKVRINKRISGTVRLTAKQKLAVRKMQRKSHSAGAVMRRMKSLRVRKQSGL